MELVNWVRPFHTHRLCTWFWEKGPIFLCRRHSVLSGELKGSWAGGGIKHEAGTRRLLKRNYTLWSSASHQSLVIRFRSGAPVKRKTKAPKMLESHFFSPWPQFWRPSDLSPHSETGSLRNVCVRDGEAVQNASLRNNQARPRGRAARARWRVCASCRVWEQRKQTSLVSTTTASVWKSSCGTFSLCCAPQQQQHHQPPGQGRRSASTAVCPCCLRQLSIKLGWMCPTEV